MQNDERFDQYLGMISEQYGQIPPAETGSGSSDFEPLPVGKYQVKVLQVVGKVSKSDNPMLEWTMEVLSPVALKGRRIWKQSMLTAKGIPYLKVDLKTLGRPWWNDISGLKTRLSELTGMILEVGHVGQTNMGTGLPDLDNRGKERRQTYINKLIMGGGVDETIPF